DEYARFFARRSPERTSSIFHRSMSQLEQQPVLRIHFGRFTRRDSEILRVEQIDAVDKPALLGVGLASCINVGVGMNVCGTALHRNPTDCITPLAQQLPESLRIVGPARKSAGNANNGDTLTCVRVCRELALR